MSTASTGPVSLKLVDVEIDGKRQAVPEGSTIVEAAAGMGITIPVLCHKPGMAPVGVCRVCAVQVQMRQKDGTVGPPGRVYTAACMKTVDPGMVVTTGVGASVGATANPDAKRVESARKTLVELLLSEHPVPCERHKDSHDCELEVLGEKLGLLGKPVFTPRAYSKGTDFSNPQIAIDHSACILCDRCVRACATATFNVLGRMGKGSLTSVSFDNNQPMGDSSCHNCGECMINCPTGAITYSGGAPTRLEVGTPLTVEQAKQLPLFEKISSAFLSRSMGGIVRRTFKKGEVICRQGEFGSTAFYIESGKVDVYLDTSMSHIRTKDEGGGFFKRVTSLLMPRHEQPRAGMSEQTFIPIDASCDLDTARPIAQVGAGEVIGEACCLNFQPRSATVRAAEDTVVLELLRNAFDILRRNKLFKAEMEKKYRQRALDNHLRSVPIFRKLSQDFIDYLRERVELVQFSPGEAICRQGDVADAFFLVRMGHVKVFEGYADGQSMVLSYLSRGQYFGEMGLLGGGERTASCSALDHVELVRISKDDFAEMLRRFPDIKADLEQVAHDRSASNRLRATQNRTLSLPQYIDQGLYQAQSLLILDLEKCTRCDECVRACAQAHDGVSRLIRDGIRYDKYLVTTSCRSCRDPYCMVGCPVGSIRRKNDLEIIIEDWCIGCGRCAEQCPYGNISMHPFELDVRDLSTGETRRETRSKAAVCDLCTDQCLTETDEPSCVYACPHDAAHRVDGQSFFDTHLLGANLTSQKKT
jgi:CRP-like cAMP-binding protein/Pyruvate/2-oxoacid:ferredoxin oxidoreductase delta subunit